MTEPNDLSNSPVFAHARGLGPQVSAPVSPWTVGLAVIAALALGTVVFVSLQSGREAKIRAAERAYQAANPPYVPPPPPPMVVVPATVDPSLPPPLPNAPAAPAFAPAPIPAPITPTSDPYARLRAPAMIVDLSGQRGAVAGLPDSGSAPSLPGRVSGEASGADASKMSAEERFAERVAGSTSGTARASRLSDLSSLAAQGTVIPAVLETAINSSLPGFARAVVTRDVRGFDGSRVLIPRGSKLIGQYRSGVAAGQSRAFVVWSRVLTPDGVSVDIGSPGGDRLGRGGLEGETDNHFFRRFGASILLSVLSAGLDAAVGDRNGGNAIIIGSPAQAASVAQIALQKEIDIPPTIKVPQGEPIRVFVARDLDFSTVSPAATPTR